MKQDHLDKWPPLSAMELLALFWLFACQVGFLNQLMISLTVDSEIGTLRLLPAGQR